MLGLACFILETLTVQRRLNDSRLVSTLVVLLHVFSLIAVSKPIVKVVSELFQDVHASLSHLRVVLDVVLSTL